MPTNVRENTASKVKMIVLPHLEKSVKLPLIFKKTSSIKSSSTPQPLSTSNSYKP